MFARKLAEVQLNRLQAEVDLRQHEETPAAREVDEDLAYMADVNIALQQHPEIRQLSTQLEEQLEERKKFLATVNKDHPQVKKIETDVDRLRTILAERTAALLPEVRESVNRGLNDQARKQAAAKTKSLRADLSRLRKLHSLLQSEYDALIDQARAAAEADAKRAREIERRIEQQFDEVVAQQQRRAEQAAEHPGKAEESEKLTGAQPLVSDANVFPIRGHHAALVEKQLVDLFGVDAGKSGLQISTDRTTNAIIVVGPPDRVKLVAEAIRVIDGQPLAPAASVSEKATGYRQREQEAAAKAEALRKLAAELPAGDERLEKARGELRAAVAAAYQARQELGQAEIAALRGRLARLEQQITARDALREQIIDRRVEDLLQPDRQWESSDEPLAAPQTRPQDGDVVRQRAESSFNLIDKDKDGTISEPEWKRSLAVRRRFEKAGITVQFPLSKEDFVQIFLKADRPSRPSDDSAFLGREPRLPEARLDPSADPRQAIIDAEAALVVARAAEVVAERDLEQARDQLSRLEKLKRQGVVAADLEPLITAVAEAGTALFRARNDIKSAERRLALTRQNLDATIKLLELELNGAEQKRQHASQKVMRLRALRENGAVQERTVADAVETLHEAELEVKKIETRAELYRRALPTPASAPRSPEGLDTKATTDGKAPSLFVDGGLPSLGAVPWRLEPETDVDGLLWSTLGVRLSPGARVAKLAPDNVFRGEGLNVAEVSTDGPAFKAGLQKGDLIVGIDSYRLHRAEEVAAIIKPIFEPRDEPGPNELSVIVIRGDEAHVARLGVPSPHDAASKKS
ncbi:MAG: secretin N-terminal domain-containing protein [Planctomycetaceae bacterium]